MTPTRARRLATVAAYAGSVAASGYGALKLSWSLGGSIGVRGTPAWEDLDGLWHLLAFESTVLLAVLAAAILLALVQPWGRRLPQRPLRALAWLGCALMLPVGLVGTAGTLAEWSGLAEPSDEGLALGVFGFVYGCFLVLGVAFAAVAWLTRRPVSARS